MISLLVSAEELSGDRLQVGGEPYRHLFRARRLASGGRLRLTDGAGRARWGRVEDIGPRSALVLLEGQAPTHDPPAVVRLLVAMPRLQRASWMVEKATELGAAEIRFLETERTVHRLTEANLERLRRVAAAALEQCHGSTLPRITGLHALSEVPELAAGCAERRFLDLPAGAAEAAEARAARRQAGHAGPPAGSGAEGLALLVGPEGGWTRAERDAFPGWECRPWGLGPRVLRVETAAVAALTLWLYG